MTIQLPALADWQDIDAQLARLKVGEEGAPWSKSSLTELEEQDYLERLRQAAASRRAPALNFNGYGKAPGYIRLGVGIGLRVRYINPDKDDLPVLADDGVTTEDGIWGALFVEFGEGHPKAGMLTSPAGLWQEGTPKEAAFEECGEEFIITCPANNTVGYWLFNNQPLAEEWVGDYANAHSMKIDPMLVIELNPIADLDNKDKTILAFGGNTEEVILAAEPKTGSLEGTWAMEATISRGIRVVDGERLPDGTWLHRRIVCASCLSAMDTLVDGKIVPPTNLTSKAMTVLLAGIGH